MALVFVTVRWFRSESMDLTTAIDIAAALPKLAATGLHIEEILEAHLTAEDIEVMVDEGNSEVDVLPRLLDFVVRVEAPYFSQREEAVYATAEWIKSQLLERFPNLSSNVRIVLQIAGYAETG